MSAFGYSLLILVVGFAIMAWFFKPGKLDLPPPDEQDSEHENKIE